MNDIALEAPTPLPAATAKRSVVLGLLAVVVLGGATSALFTLEACAEKSPAQPTTAPSTTASAPTKPTATPTAPPPTPPLPPPPT